MAQKYWFKRRRYGYGWVPTTIQGWLTIIIFVLAEVGAAFLTPIAQDNPTFSDILPFLLYTAILISIFFAVLLWKGPSPKWRWGKSHKDNPHEDW